MPKYVYVQIQGVEAPAKIAADKVEKRMSDSTLVVKNGDEQVGSSSWACSRLVDTGRSKLRHAVQFSSLGSAEMRKCTGSLVVCRIR